MHRPSEVARPPSEGPGVPASVPDCHPLRTQCALSTPHLRLHIAKGEWGSVLTPGSCHTRWPGARGKDGPASEPPRGVLLSAAWPGLERWATSCHQLPPAATGLAALGCFASRSLLSVLCMTLSLVSTAASVLLRFSELFLLGLPDSGTIQKAFSENPCEPGAGHGQATGWRVLLLLSRDSECVVDRVPTWLGSRWLGPPALPHSRMLKPGRQADRRR